MGTSLRAPTRTHLSLHGRVAVLWVTSVTLMLPGLNFQCHEDRYLALEQSLPKTGRCIGSDHQIFLLDLGVLLEFVNAAMVTDPPLLDNVGSVRNLGGEAEILLGQ